jgi:glycosyltransferase involved in cell wall biosynthesis
MPKISVIVPVYNTSKFLERCLNSILQQTLEDIEIIAIDDGSTDNSLDILQKSSTKDKRIKVYTQQHQGISVTRNLSIKLAKAEIISFIDSDDTIKKNMLEIMYDRIIQDVDIVFTRCNYLDSLNNIIKISKKLPTKKDIYFLALLKNHLSPGTPMGLYKKQLFINNNIFFPENEYFEDLKTTYKLFYYAKNISVIQEPLYNYHFNNNSISNTLSKKHILDLFKSHNDKKEFLSINNILKIYKEEHNKHLISLIDYIFYKISQNNFSINKIKQILFDMWNIIYRENYANELHISQQLLLLYQTLEFFPLINDQNYFLQNCKFISNHKKSFLYKTIKSKEKLFIYALQKLKNDNPKKIYLYGAGKICETIIPFIEKEKIEIINIIDTYAKTRSKISKYTIIPLQDFKDVVNKKTVVFITSEKFAYEITNNLLNINRDIKIINFYDTITQ